ncbi:unnamed protein product (macronuclear) [Paramecium tetraurelia]|uniref:Uncharacterized protein n=1 Tax=Paramecium tetraurelia TaxID=5888 RepID=A0E8D5_PARTE|nr:uncharacterized protein GSPATT00024280001 [Paramecium tetraurelia]CAK91552.1 unnamed protein product [Paramecium tetraurelia]|eukprot:XP_001458949.1 hypothetical protein (macronuclear) [Paramecium tetraurelia strain d4-2]
MIKMIKQLNSQCIGIGEQQIECSDQEVGLDDIPQNLINYLELQTNYPQSLQLCQPISKEDLQMIEQQICHIIQAQDLVTNQECSEFQDFQISQQERKQQLILKYKKIFIKLNNFNYPLQNSLMLQLQFPNYLRITLQIFKKVTQTTQLSNNIIQFIINYAQNKQLEQPYVELSSKIIKLCKEFDNLDQFQLVNQENLLSRQPNDEPNLQNTIWTRQQMIQCLILYTIVRCELLIFNQKTKISLNYEQNIANISKHINMCTYDYSWSENCLGNIRDYHPKLAKKLNKRYSTVRNLETSYEKQISIAIFNYTQSLLGYFHHHYSYSSMQLDQDVKDKIKSILNGKITDCDLSLVIIVANAVMFVQILYALK